MCGRYVSPGQAAIERAWHIGRHNQAPFERRFNVFPTATIPLLRLADEGDVLELVTGRWGLVPHWWKQAKLPALTHNARMEAAAGKPMWRDAWRHARCLIPAEGWYEWQAVERIDPVTGEVKPVKQPYYFHRADGRLLGFAGLMSRWTNPGTGAQLISCAVLSTAAQGELAKVHDRAPVALPEAVHAAWLDRQLDDPARVQAIADTHAGPEEFEFRKVGPLVNDTRRDGPELIEPLESRA